MPNESSSGSAPPLNGFPNNQGPMGLAPGNSHDGGSPRSSLRPSLYPTGRPQQPQPISPAVQIDPKYAFPDWSKDKVTCYNTGQTTTHDWMVEVIGRFCAGLVDGGPIENGDKTGDVHFYAREDDPFWSVWVGINGAVDVIISAEVKRGCKWTPTENDCEIELRKPVNDCDTNTADGKHGGTVENDCLYLRIDANVRILLPELELC